MKLGKKAILPELFQQILILGIFIIAILAYGVHEAEDTNMARTYIVRDVSILADAVSGVSGQISVPYLFPEHVHLLKAVGPYKLDFKFENNLFDVSGKKYPYAKDLFFNYNLPSIQNSTGLKILNHNSVFEIQDYLYLYGEQSFILKELKYFPVKTTNTGWQSKIIVIKPETEPLAKLFFIANTRRLNLKKTNDKNAVVTIIINSEKSQNLVVEIPPEAKSRKLASLFINNVLKQQDKKSLLKKTYIRIIDKQPETGAYIKIIIGTGANLKTPLLNEALYTSLEEYFK